MFGMNLPFMSSLRFGCKRRDDLDSFITVLWSVPSLRSAEKPEDKEQCQNLKSKLHQSCLEHEVHLHAITFQV